MRARIFSKSQNIEVHARFGCWFLPRTPTVADLPRLPLRYIRTPSVVLTASCCSELGFDVSWSHSGAITSWGATVGYEIDSPSERRTHALRVKDTNWADGVSCQQAHRHFMDFSAGLYALPPRIGSNRHQSDILPHHFR